MARKRSRDSASAAAPARRRLRPLHLMGALAAAGLVSAIVAGVAASQPGPGHEWHALEPGLGRIRWVSTTADPNIDPPLAPEWIRALHSWSIPFPTDLPLKPVGASFGANSSGAAWFLIQNSRASNDLWHADKASVRLTDPAGNDIAWPGGTGAALVDPDRRLQYLYLGVPATLSGAGAHAHFRVARFDGPSSAEVSLPF